MYLTCSPLSDCGLRTHDKCTSSVGRICASSIVTRRDFTLKTTICQEKGLAAQNYRCAECSHPLSFGMLWCISHKYNKCSFLDGASALEPRLCDYSGLYFCSSCHWNDQVSVREEGGGVYASI